MLPTTIIDSLPPLVASYFASKVLFCRNFIQI